jgi:hypothetical protein
MAEKRMANWMTSRPGFPRSMVGCPHPRGKTPCPDCGIGPCITSVHKTCPGCGAWMRYCLSEKGHAGPHRWLEGDGSRVHVKCALRHKDPDHSGPHQYRERDPGIEGVAQQATGAWNPCLAIGHPAVTDASQAQRDPGVVYGPCYVGE